MRTVLRETLWWIRKAPVTTGIVLVAIAVGIAMNALWVPAPSSGLADTYGWGLPAFARGEWWTLLVGAFIAPCLLYTSPSPRDRTRSRMPSSA